jgi:hypothetical protein
MERPQQLIGLLVLTMLGMISLLLSRGGGALASSELGFLGAEGRSATPPVLSRKLILDENTAGMPLQGNHFDINGPSVIRAPDWLPDRHDEYYM